MMKYPAQSCRLFSC